MADMDEDEAQLEAQLAAAQKRLEALRAQVQADAEYEAAQAAEAQAKAQAKAEKELAAEAAKQSTGPRAGGSPSPEISVGADDYADETPKKKKKKKRRTPKSTPGTPGRRSLMNRASPMNATSIDREFHKEAWALMEQPDTLLKLMRDKVFRDACQRCGVEVTSLAPLTRADFRCEPGRAIEVTPLQQDMRFEAYENRRRTSLALVLAKRKQLAAEHKAEFQQAEKQAENMANVFEKALNYERKRLAKIASSRAKFEQVTAQENDVLAMRRSAFDRQKGEFEDKQRRIVHMQMAKKEYLADRAKARSQNIKRVADQREGRARSRKETLERNRLAKIRRVEKFMVEKYRHLEERKKAEGSSAVVREKRRAAFKERENQKRIMLQEKLKTKLARVEAAAQRKQAGQIERSEKRRLARLEKQANAERVRRAKEVEKKKVADKIQAAWGKMEAMVELREALVEERRRLAKEEIIRRDKWKDETKLLRTITPGPGEYHRVKNASDTIKGGTWGRHVFRST